ncbi:hypothetical protein CTAYLR_004917 [Chrysophaeum taylorii]|uniref:Uncharacterized protein n=1 Tax=Chrysophaeum taylorii TaxID=2483200 RepID=A0AAD7UP64_9STRA|nr:hypothetical protein CTAYLR_004917 [Chrysophaeum taylorii]
MEVLREMTAETGGVMCEEAARLSKADFTDNVPNLQCQSMALEFGIRSGANSISYQDHVGLDTSFGPEIKATAEVESLLAEGAEHIYMLYTFRSVGRAVPMAPGNELNMKTFEVLLPQIAKIRRLMDFQEKGIVIIERCMKSLVTPEARARVVPDGYYDAITKVIDLLQKLDNLKDMKASLTTDFSRYNRVLQALRAELPNGDQLAQEKHRLQLFLSNFQYPKSLIFQNLRDVLKKIPGHEEVLIEMLQQNIDFIENERYLTPDEKYRLIRSLPHLMLLIDGSTNVFKDKRIALKPLQAIFRAYPVVPEYGDMSMTMLVILRRATHWDASMEKTWEDKKIASRYSLLTHWPDIKVKYFEFLSKFSKTTTELATYKFCKGLSATTYAKFVSRLASDGFKMLQTWTCLVLEAYHWKLTHPAAQGSPYEAAVKNNYNARERGVLVDVISMIKSLASELASAEAAVAPYVRLHVHHEVQQFVAGELLPPLHRAHKRNRAIIEPLLKLRRLVADWPDKVEPDDYVKYSRQDGRVEAKHPVRVVGPSPTQLQLMRTMVRSMYDQRNQLKVGYFSKKDLEKEDINLMETFYNESLAFQYLLNYSDTLRANSDLGDLWYREFYLELSGQIQFPIELSLPWILTEHIIRHQAEAMPLVENILYTMDAYNDAAHRALYVLNQRFLYDEIEAELNLVFDQLVFLVADYAYSHHKDNAAARQLDEPYVERLRQSRKAQKKLVDPPARRLGIPLAQRRVQLLGRVIDLNVLIAQHVNAKLYKDVEFCLKKFEACDLSTIVDYERALRVVEATRDSLAEHLELDPFAVIVAEIDEAVGPSAFAGRAMMHVLGSLVTDVVPNYSYNAATRRFVRSPAVFKPLDRPKAPKADHQHLGFGARCQRAYDMANKLHRGFVGVQHSRSVVQVLGSSAVPLLVNNLLANLGEKLEISKAYLDAITEGLPPCKLPKSMYGLAGVYGVFDALLKPILAYQDLKPEVFQALKEIGNTLLFIRDLSDVLDRQDLERLVHAAPYVDPLTPILSAKVSDDAPPPARRAAVDAVATPPPLVAAANAVAKHATLVSPQEIADLAQTAAALHSGVLCDRSVVPPPPRRSRAPRTSLFHGAVKQLATFVEPLRPSWANSAPANGVIDLEATSDFHRLWSALSFLFGVQPGKYDDDDEKKTLAVHDDAQFGHGFFVAGASLIHVLGQKSQFDALDFTNHVLRVRLYEQNSITKSPGVGADASLDQDAENFARLKIKHRRVFEAAFDMFKATAPDLEPPPLDVPFRAPRSDDDVEGTKTLGRQQTIAIQKIDSPGPSIKTSPTTTKSPMTPSPPPPPKLPRPPSPDDDDDDRRPKSSFSSPPPPPPPMPSTTKPLPKPPPPMPSSKPPPPEDQEQPKPPPPPPMPTTSASIPPMPKPPPPMPLKAAAKPPPPMPNNNKPRDDDDHNDVDDTRGGYDAPKPSPPRPSSKPPPPMPQTAKPKPPPPAAKKKPPPPPKATTKGAASPVPSGGPKPALPFLAGINQMRQD